MSETSTHFIGQPGPARRARPRVALVNMPWARTDMPSIQCGLLKSELARAGWPAEVHYLNLDLAEHIGAPTYQGIMGLYGERARLLGEWLFGAVAFDDVLSDEEYFDLVSIEHCCAKLGLSRDDLLHLRYTVLPAWIRRCADQECWGSYDVVGFTSTFEQNVASMALARRLKERRPGLITIFGGANFDGQMGAEYVRVFPWMDYAISGEGDVAFPAFVAAVAAGRDPTDVEGVCGRDAAGQLRSHQAAAVQDMDLIPVPDYSDYFDAVAQRGQAAVMANLKPALLYETARGCWWGAKHHCTFCGLNALGMQFRAKSPDKAFDGLAEMTSRHHLLDIYVVDNILDMKYINSFCSRLAAQRWDLHLYYEVKANLTREQLHILGEAGIRSIQPGIESLSSHVLSLMRKGSTLLLNLRILKWSRYHDIQVDWNILTGFPGETDEDYEEQIRLIPSLYHIPPPQMTGPIWLERFSPYFMDRSFPISSIQPAAAYRYVYPAAELSLSKIAYFFDYRAEPTASAEVIARLSAEVAQWRAIWEQRRPALCYERGPGWLKLRDTRGEAGRETTFSGWRAQAYELCGESARAARAIEEELHRFPDVAVPPEAELVRFLRGCVAERLMVSEDDRYFSLALPTAAGW
jgi:ribosomal peptide maturation radical SAM protein 1